MCRTQHVCQTIFIRLLQSWRTEFKVFVHVKIVTDTLHLGLVVEHRYHIQMKHVVLRCGRLCVLGLYYLFRWFRNHWRVLQCWWTSTWSTLWWKDKTGMSLSFRFQAVIISKERATEEKIQSIRKGNFIYGYIRLSRYFSASKIEMSVNLNACYYYMVHLILLAKPSNYSWHFWIFSRQIDYGSV